MNKYLVEFIGTFFLVFTVGNIVLNPTTPLLGALAIAASLMVMIFAGGHISGGHFNPAVTLAVTMRGKCAVSDVAPYMIAQVLAGVAAAFAAMFLWDGGAAEFIDLKAVTPKAMLVEFLLTFALCYVVLNVATADGTAGNSFYGLAIGFVVLIGAISVGGISGGAFNPAVATGLCVMKKAAWPDIWIYLVPQLVAGALAAVVFRIVNGGDDE
jgi:aquaporin Z